MICSQSKVPEARDERGDDMPGFAMLEPRMEKLGIKGTATS